MDILNYKDVKDELLNHWEHGGGKTYYIGFPESRPLYQVMKGSCTDITGYPVSGKTQFLKEVLINLSEFWGWKHLIYLPDAGTNVEILSDLIHKFSGKTFQKTFSTSSGNVHDTPNHITAEEVEKYAPLILENFRLMKTDKLLTPKEYWNFAKDNWKELGIDSASIDSWNYLKHDLEGYSREDKWLEDTLSYRNQLAEETGLHFFTLIHPKNPTKSKDGKIIMPTEHDIKGGSEWFNNGKSILIVHRESKEQNFADIYVRKAKPRVVGKVGFFTLNFDLETSRYYYLDHQASKHFASKGEQPIYNPDQFIEPTNDVPF